MKVALWVPWHRFKAELDEIKEAIAVLRHLMGQHQHVTGAAFQQLQEEVRKMATRDELNQVKQELLQAIQDETTQVTNDIQALRDQLAQGQPITDTDLQDLQQAIGNVKNIDPDTLPGPTSQKKS
jgi:chromosome segregation ATPase